MLLRRDFNHARARARAGKRTDTGNACRIADCRCRCRYCGAARRKIIRPEAIMRVILLPERASERASESPLSRSCRERRQFIHIELRSHYIGGSSIDRSTGRVHTALHCARDCRQEEDEEEEEEEDLKFNAYCKPCVHPRVGRGVLGEVVERRGGGRGARTCIIKRRRWAGRARGPTNLMYGLWTD